MNVKYVVASVLALGTIVGSIAGIRSATVGTPDIAHADVISPFVGGTATQLLPLSVAVAGSGFTQGGRVHVELLVAYWPFGSQPDSPTDSEGSSGLMPTVAYTPTGTLTPRILGASTIVDSIDTTVARTTNVPNGHGVVFRRVGGWFNTILAASDTSCLDYDYWLVATDQTTGITVTGPPTEEDNVCL